MAGARDGEGALHRRGLQARQIICTDRIGHPRNDLTVLEAVREWRVSLTLHRPI